MGMSEAFVYIWHNLTNGRRYVGYHLGSEEDGYVCSSKNEHFWEDWETDEWEREILFRGTQKECIDFEMERLENLDESYYNLWNKRSIVFTPQVRKKMSDAKRGKPGCRLGQKSSEEHKRKVSEALKGKPWTEKRRLAYENGPKTRKPQKRELK